MQDEVERGTWNYSRPLYKNGWHGGDTGRYLKTCRFCYRQLFDTKDNKDGKHTMYCTSECRDEYEFNQDLKNLFLGKPNNIHFDLVKEELYTNKKVTRIWAKKNINPVHLSYYIKKLRQTGIDIVTKGVSSLKNYYLK